MTPLTTPVDVIVPAYNVERYLCRAIDSVLAQTYPHWRILLMDDGSRDGTSALAKEYAARLGPGRMLALHQPNRGLPAARNAAIRAGHAPLLALLDSDDEWLPERLAQSVAALEQHPEAGLAYGFVRRVDEENRHVSTHDHFVAGREGYIADAIYTRRIHLPCPTVTFRRELWQAAGGFDESLRATEDRDLWLRIALGEGTGQPAAVRCIPKILALYRVTPGAMTTDAERMFTAQQRFLLKHRRAPGLSPGSYRQARSGILRQRAETEGNRRDLLAALRHIFEALVLMPAASPNWITAASILRHGWKSRS